MVNTANLVSAYNFNDDVIDSVGSNDGTNNGCSFVAGHLNNCIEGDGVNDYVNCGNDSSFDFTTGMTFEAWIYKDANNDVVAAKYVGASGTDYAWDISFGGTGILYFGINGTTNRANTGAFTLSNSTWYHIVCSYDKSNIKIFVDGVLRGIYAYSNNINVNTHDVRIGARGYVGAEGYFNGKIDAAKLWNAAISDGGTTTVGDTATGDVAALYNGGTGLEYPFSSTTLEVTSPNGGESYKQGSSQSITWTDSGSVANVKIELSTDNGSSYSDVVSSTSNTGSYSWTVPVENSSQCLIKISDVLDSDSFDVSNAVFTISTPPSTAIGGNVGFVQSWLKPLENWFSRGFGIREFPNSLIRDYARSQHLQITGDFTATVVKVHDGDTVTLRTSFRDFDFPLRLANIDALELSEGGAWTRDWLKSRVLGKKVQVLIDPKNRVGKYGRLIGELFVDGVNVNDEMLRMYYAPPFGGKIHRIESIGKLLKRAGYIYG